MRIEKLISLSWRLAKKELFLRYEGSYLGVFWYLLKPFLLFTLLLLVFSRSFGTTIKFYPIYLLIGVIMWNLLTNASFAGMNSTNNKLIKSINFPKEALVISSVLSYFISHMFEIIIFIIFLVLFGINVLNMIFYFVLLVFFFFFVLGVSFFISSVNLYFRDTFHIWGFITTALLFLTPIFYILEEGGIGYIVNLFNPLYYFVTAAREIIIYARVSGLIIFGVIIYPLISFIVGYIVFNRLKNKFAELI